MQTHIDPTTATTLRPWFPDLDLDRIRLHDSGPICWFVRTILKQGAMTIAPHVFYGRERFDPGDAGSIALLAHELRHVEQYRRLGYAGFFLRYFRDLARARFHYGPELPLEAECYSLQSEVERALRA
jgi:hypothetical protein